MNRMTFVDKYGNTLLSPEYEEVYSQNELIDALLQRLVTYEEAGFEPNKVVTNKWISVKDRLPEEKKMVLAYTPVDGFMFVGFYDKSSKSYRLSKEWCIVTAMRGIQKVTKKVTHWMPLPEPPTEG